MWQITRERTTEDVTLVCACPQRVEFPRHVAS